MRKTFTQYLKPSEYLLHADMLNPNKFPTKAKLINCRLGESNLLNVAGGIASQYKTVYIYGVCKFIIYNLRQLELSCKEYGAKFGKIIILNAGEYGYSNMGLGHKIQNDNKIMEMLGIPIFIPDTPNELIEILDYLRKQPFGIFYVRLGKDF